MSSLGFFQRLKKALNLSGDDAVSSKPSVSEQPAPVSIPSTAPAASRTVEIDTGLFAKQCLKLAGGHANVTRIDACVTRVRLTVKDNSVVTDAQLKGIGAAAVVRVGDKNLQVVVGPMALDIAEEMKKIPASEDLSKIEVPA